MVGLLGVFDDAAGGYPSQKDGLQLWLVLVLVCSMSSLGTGPESLTPPPAPAAFRDAVTR